MMTTSRVFTRGSSHSISESNFPKHLSSMTIANDFRTIVANIPRGNNPGFRWTSSNSAKQRNIVLPTTVGDLEATLHNVVNNYIRIILYRVYTSLVAQSSRVPRAEPRWRRTLCLTLRKSLSVPSALELAKILFPFSSPSLLPTRAILLRIGTKRSLKGLKRSSCVGLHSSDTFATQPQYNFFYVFYLCVSLPL